MPDLSDYLTVPQIAQMCGVTGWTVHSWLKYHRYMPYERILDRPVVRRSDVEIFMREHPELIKVPQEA